MGASASNCDGAAAPRCGMLTGRALRSRGPVVASRWRDRHGALVRLAGLLILLAAFVLPGPVPAQEAAAGSVRIGVILPEVGGGDVGASVAASVEQGLVMAQEEFGFNAGLFQIEFSALSERASGGGVVEAAERLAEQGALAIVGGHDQEEAYALGEWAASRGIAFINIGTSSDALRNENCFATTFHVAPSAAMYIDALAGWYVRSGFRQWYFLQEDNAESAAQYDRALEAIEERHFGVRAVGRTIVPPDGALSDEAIADVADSRADLVVLLMSAANQLRVLSALEAAGLEIMVAGFPYPEAQTREFFEASRAAAPTLGTGFRATAWEPTLDAYGARELNARYGLRWEAPMESAAWASYQAVKILYEAAVLGGSATSEAVLAYLNSPTSVFDVWKGIGTSFRPWDRQLRQSLFLVKINESATPGAGAATLVGELPAIYMPGTDPVERLDQLGDLEAASQCDA